MKKERLAVISIVVSLLIMLCYNLHTNSMNVKEEENPGISYSKEEKLWIAGHSGIYVELSEDLKYLNMNGEGEQGGFLAEYLGIIGEHAGMDIQLVTDKEDRVDSPFRLVIMTQEIREQTEKYSFTLPVLRLRGSLFLTTGKSIDELSGQDQLLGVCVKGTFTKKEKEALEYNGVSIALKEFDTMQKAVAYAELYNTDCIAGDESAVFSQLKKDGYMGNYRDSQQTIYETNACIAVEKGNAIPFNILNNSLRSISSDEKILRQMQGEWFGLPYSFVKEQNFADFGILLLIVFTAVLCAFFLYYQTNKNLYDELRERMNQLLSSQREMATTFNGVPYYMAELDKEGSILDINKAMGQYLCNVETEIIGSHIADVIAMEEPQRQKLVDALGSTMLLGAGQSLELLQKKQILEINTFPIENSKGKIEKILFMASDVTGVKAAERQMIQDNKMIAVGQLMAGIAHEIKNPLGLIRNCCYILKNKDEDNPEAEAQAVGMIEKSIENSARIIDNLLNFSRISNYELQELSIKKHIDSIVMLNSSKWKKRK